VQGRQGKGEGSWLDSWAAGGEGCGDVVAEVIAKFEAGDEQGGSRREDAGRSVDEDWGSVGYGDDRDLKGGKRKREAAAIGLDDGLLAGPAEEEGAVPIVGYGEQGDLAGLGGGERGAGDLKDVSVAVEVFEIDADGGVAAEGDEDGGTGVGEIEINGVAGYLRLAVGAEDDGDLPGRTFEVDPEEGAERGACDGELLMDVGDAEALGAGEFFGGEEVVARNRRGGEIDAPELEFAGRERGEA